MSSKTRILPARSFRLGGAHLQAGVPAWASAADAELALRHGWAVAAPEKPPAKAAEAGAARKPAAALPAAAAGQGSGG